MSEQSDKRPRVSWGADPVLGTPGEVTAALQRTVTALLRAPAGAPLRALEAGAGKRIRLDVPEDAYIVGVDTDDTAMHLNPRLHERVVGDLHDYAAPPDSFDLITCWYVLEHVERPEELIARFARMIAPGGLVVLAVPHLWSPKSLFTKLTPHAFHVWFRRRVLGFPNAGKPGYGPYPTTLRRTIAPAAIAALVARHGLAPVFEGYFEDEKQARFRRRLRITGRRWALVRGLVRALSLGLLDAARSEYVVVLRRDPARPRAGGDVRHRREAMTGPSGQ
ncbi:class I SAM-dependent methyltransferase [Catenuloplanes indicus]|uniref:SAM-dependent methyltransferase n=1 Tax=Catenuloplanes indicus TaxID=137267 RepID=A0AAE4B048_9ACTN|nr:class I SAM-dependent methyltransferase [Catenuloplanes indicus]MDQ0366528.1 SAM-dependent methyltransferase [Catenuloplanes indicus]